MPKSREGRHTATASTWLMRHGFASNREEAVKLVKRGKVKIFDRLAHTRIGYTRPTKLDIDVITE